MVGYNCSIVMKKTLSIKKGSTSFLKFVIFIVALLSAAILLWFPHLEGRNDNATLFQIYFTDPFLAYIYLASTPYFVALYQAFQLLGLIELNQAFSMASVTKLRNIKRCAFAIIFFGVGCTPFFLQAAQAEDAPGFMVIELVIIVAAITVATFAAVLQKLLQSAADLQEENELTV